MDLKDRLNMVIGILSDMNIPRDGKCSNYYREDSKESITRRLMFCREELLKIQKSLVS